MSQEKDMYVASKISVINQELDEIFRARRFEKASFSEALSLLEQHSTKLSLDSSIHTINFKENSIGVVEEFTNVYASSIYEKIFKASKGQLKELLDRYYLKYQIHNIIVTLRCIASDYKDDIEFYLIGNKIQKEHCIKSVSFSYEESLKYFSTKFKFPKSLLKYNTIDTIMQLETGLYKWYHEDLQKFLSEKYSNSTLQIEHKKHIDVLNKKIIKVAQEIEDFNVDEFFINGGYKKTSDLKSSNETLEELEELQLAFKSEVYNKTKFEGFGTHFMILNFLQRFEIRMREISKQLKEKALN